MSDGEKTYRIDAIDPNQHTTVLAILGGVMGTVLKAHRTTVGAEAYEDTKATILRAIKNNEIGGLSLLGGQAATTQILQVLDFAFDQAEQL